MENFGQKYFTRARASVKREFVILKVAKIFVSHLNKNIQIIRRIKKKMLITENNVFWKDKIACIENMPVSLG